MKMKKKSEKTKDKKEREPKAFAQREGKNFIYLFCTFFGLLGFKSHAIGTVSSTSLL